jgi:hypothetical protein
MVGCPPACLDLSGASLLVSLYGSLNRRLHSLTHDAGMVSDSPLSREFDSEPDGGDIIGPDLIIAAKCCACGAIDEANSL